MRVLSLSLLLISLCVAEEAAFSPTRSVHHSDPEAVVGESPIIKAMNVNKTPKVKHITQSEYNAWSVFKSTIGQNSISAATENDRKLAFVNAHRFVRVHNSAYQRGDVSFEVEANYLANMPRWEYLRRNTFRAMPLVHTRLSIFAPPFNVHDAAAVDWRNESYVTEVKNQGRCGSCWAFATTGVIEGQLKRKSGQLVSLSEQNLVDCDHNDHGCGGGWFSTAFDYIHENGIEAENVYPYVGHKNDTTCRVDKREIVTYVRGYQQVPPINETALRIAVATQGPVAVAVDASLRSFQMYKTGVYYDPECSQVIDHAVLVVGYGTDELHGDFWIVKNSWGSEWGERGYIRMARNRNNHCGIASHAFFPLI